MGYQATDQVTTPSAATICCHHLLPPSAATICCHHLLPPSAATICCPCSSSSSIITHHHLPSSSPIIISHHHHPSLFTCVCVCSRVYDVCSHMCMRSGGGPSGACAAEVFVQVRRMRARRRGAGRRERSRCSEQYQKAIRARAGANIEGGRSSR